MTNNLIRQMIKTIVGRYRTECITNRIPANKNVALVHEQNQLEELDSRALEEFLISGTAVQRIAIERDLWRHWVRVENVNLNNFFINHIEDPLARDCEMVGQLHELYMAQLLKIVARGSRSKARWIRNLYRDHSQESHRLCPCHWCRLTLGNKLLDAHTGWQVPSH